MQAISKSLRQSSLKGLFARQYSDFLSSIAPRNDRFQRYGDNNRFGDRQDNDDEGGEEKKFWGGSFTFYKGKGALQVSLVKPKERRKGSIILSAAPAVAPQKYDWGNKIFFSINALEISDLLVKTKARRELSLFHDPNKKSMEEGREMKTLKLTPLPAQNNEEGMMLYLNHKVAHDAAASKQVGVALTASEVYLFRQLCKSSLPIITGFLM
mmetsp:Transcript_10347/g.27111  ORF Transcript_10347/g.27111 Transcript_10347/m.27111 type:complete len:211 (+) Transcript_10347:1558-2190(+)|eukprot:CAMPEP_0113892808 /NCGR_PEP_ID=MMETSP0780_2-20120614/15660_1 /TAXON_ID=652834 /ORGANISM="Palpitomonas bilix" /LENGTH=210 /DNA_ID=CAMNT_0000882863 /DNA_START=10 /DNA_END=642 /DNA_ORIENTATION=+ /assembly_acc=CAM_ASM_000599